MQYFLKFSRACLAFAMFLVASGASAEDYPEYEGLYLRLNTGKLIELPNISTTVPLGIKGTGGFTEPPKEFPGLTVIGLRKAAPIERLSAKRYVLDLPVVKAGKYRQS